MSEQPWETHDKLCSSRRPSVAYPRRACPECGSIDMARREGQRGALADPALITRIRNDALSGAVQRVEALPHDPDCRSYRDGVCSCPWRAYIIAAIKALAPEEEK
jgi:hypothetical protein